MSKIIFFATCWMIIINFAYAQKLSSAATREIAKEAYIYGFPLVDNYRIQYEYFVNTTGRDYKGPWNKINILSHLAVPTNKTIPTPNADTAYAFLGADLRTEPLVLSFPAVEKERYYSVQFIDMYTYNFGYVGSRATGNCAGNVLLAGPQWKGEKPNNIQTIIRSDTDFAFVIYRVQLFNYADMNNVKKIQAEFKVEPLSRFLGKAPPEPAPPISFIKPLTIQTERTSPQFFNILNFVLQFCPVLPEEKSLRERFAQIGIEAGKIFNPQSLSRNTLDAIQKGISDAWIAYAENQKRFIEGKLNINEMAGSKAQLKNNYLNRMQTAVDGIYANSSEEAIYPIYFVDESGAKLTGEHQYTLTFPQGQLPPVNAFWSLTLYELPASLLYANPLNRYLINSAMLPSLKYNADGSITLYIQHESPGKDKETNWLPAPKGAFLIVMRLYWPEKEVSEGTWKQPALKKIK